MPLDELFGQSKVDREQRAEMTGEVAAVPALAGQSTGDVLELPSFGDAEKHFGVFAQPKVSSKNPTSSKTARGMMVVEGTMGASWTK